MTLTAIGDGREQRPAPRSKHQEDGRQRQHGHRRDELRLVFEGDAVVRLADLETAVVVGAEIGRQRGRDDVPDLLDHLAARVVDSPLVEEDDQRRDRAVLGDEIAAQQVVCDRARADVRGRLRVEIVDQPANVELDVADGAGAVGRSGRAVDDRGGREAGHAVDEAHALDAARRLFQKREALAAEQPIPRRGDDSDDQRAGAAELVLEPLVLR